MSINNLVSVIIPVYNHEKYVVDSITSVLNQSYSPVEILVLNDGSTDNSHEKISELKKHHDFIYINKANEGLSKTLKRGLELCTGDYFAILASDDMWLEKKLEEQIKYMNAHDSCVACCAQVNVIDEFNNVTPGEVREKVEAFDFERIMTEGYNIPPATILIRRDKLTEDNFREDLKVEDLYLWLSLTVNGGTLDVLPQNLANYRIHSHNTTGNLALIAEYHHKTIDLFKNEKVYKRSKIEWSKFSFRQLTRKYKAYSLKFIFPDVRFFLSSSFLIGFIKLVFIWKK